MVSGARRNDSGPKGGVPVAFELRTITGQVRNLEKMSQLLIGGKLAWVAFYVWFE